MYVSVVIFINYISVIKFCIYNLVFLLKTGVPSKNIDIIKPTGQFNYIGFHRICQ